MKYKILGYDNNTNTANVRITNDHDDINTAPMFPISISNLSSVQEFEAEIFEVFTIYSSSTPTLPPLPPSISSAVTQHIIEQRNVVRQLTTSITGGVETVTSTELEDRAPINVQVL